MVVHLKVEKIDKTQNYKMKQQVTQSPIMKKETNVTLPSIFELLPELKTTNM